MKAISCKPDSIRSYVITLQPAAFYCVQNNFIDVSTECAVVIFRVNVELIGEKQNVNYVGKLQGLYPVNVTSYFNTEQDMKVLRRIKCIALHFFNFG